MDSKFSQDDTVRRLGYIIVFIVVAIAHIPFLIFNVHSLNGIWSLMAFTLLLYISWKTGESTKECKTPEIKIDENEIKKAYRDELIRLTKKQYVWKSSEFANSSYSNECENDYQTLMGILELKDLVGISKTDVISFIAFLKQNGHPNFEIIYSDHPTVKTHVLLWDLQDLK